MPIDGNIKVQAGKTEPDPAGETWRHHGETAPKSDHPHRTRLH
jgi:hypothetical protein